MFITLEHSGTQEALAASAELKDFLEDELSAQVEVAVGPLGNSIYIYRDNSNVHTCTIPINSRDKANIHYILTRS